jgi:hypothetical protein
MTAHVPNRLMIVGAIAIAGLVPLATAEAAPAPPAGAEYTFTVIADTADGFARSPDCPALNNAGEVAFHALRTTGEDQVVIGTGGDLTIIADRDEEDLGSIGREVAINDRGEVTFGVVLAGTGEAIMRGDGTTLRTVATTKGQPYADLMPMPAMDAKGRVWFKAKLDDGDYGLFSARGRGAQSTHFLASESEFDGDVSGPSVRGKRIAFTERPDSGGNGVYVLKGDKIIPIVDSSGPIQLLFDPSMGSHGRVALHAQFEDGEEALLAGRGGPVKTLVDTADGFDTFGLGSPSQNGAGEIVFTAIAQGGSGYELFDGPSPTTDLVVAIGDPLAGSEAFHLVSCRQALNDHGQIAFLARLADGRDVIVRADPVAAAPGQVPVR